MAERIAGILLFLPVPAVLWLFTRMPLGVYPSLGLGVVVMLTHRLYARPWALARASRRCLWCGRDASDGARLEMHEPGSSTTWRVCCAGHEDALRRFLGWAWRFRLLLLAGIVGGLLLLLIGAPLSQALDIGLAPADVVLAFKLSVVVAVLPLGLLGPRFGSRAEDPVATPFPVHIQSLIGSRAVTWLFRIVGLLWLVQAALHLVAR